MPMAAECKNVQRLFPSFPYLNHIIYQSSLRQYVTGNPTYTYISLTITRDKYRHINHTYFIPLHYVHT